MYDSAIHIKVDKSLAKGLKDLAAQRHTTMGHLVREAIVACYQPDILGLSKKQKQTLEAYQGGYVSIGKFAEVMGIHVLDARHWLKEHGITQNTSWSKTDADNV